MTKFELTKKAIESISNSIKNNEFSEAPPDLILPDLIRDAVRNQNFYLVDTFKDKPSLLFTEETGGDIPPYVVEEGQHVCKIVSDSYESGFEFIYVDNINGNGMTFKEAEEQERENIKENEKKKGQS